MEGLGEDSHYYGMLLNDWGRHYCYCEKNIIYLPPPFSLLESYKSTRFFMALRCDMPNPKS